MTVELTSPAMGKKVGESYTGPEEPWLLAEGYAKRAGYTGPGVSGTGPATVEPDEDVTAAANREPAPSRTKTGGVEPGPRDPAMGYTDPRKPAYDFDKGSVNDDAPTAGFTVEPSTLPLAGGEVKILGQNLEGVTGVTVGGAAATEVVVVSDSEVTATFPAAEAGAKDVVVTNPQGSATKTGGVTYAA